MASEGVACDLAETGAVGTWLGAGFRTFQSQGGSITAVHIPDNFMALEVKGSVIETARFSRHAAADGDGAWTISTQHVRLFRRIQAITRPRP
jgi:hypothetical protein